MKEAETGVMQPQSRECTQPLETGKGKKTDYPLESLEEASPADTLILAQ